MVKIQTAVIHDGPPGPAGATGATGAAGPAGADGSAITPTGNQVVAATGTGSTLALPKGALPVGNGTNVAALAVGANTQVLTADSTQTDGIKWAAATGGMTNPMTAATDMIYGGASGAPTRLPTVGVRQFPYGDGTTITKVTDRVFDVGRPPYNVDLTGSVDGTTAFQQALTDAGAVSGGATVFVPFGQVKISSGLTLPSGVILLGGYGSGGVNTSSKVGYPRIWWAGGSTTDVITIASGAGSIGWTYIERLWINAAFTGAAPFRSGIVFARQLDMGCWVRNCYIAGATDYGIDFQSGAINAYLRDLRLDNNRKYGIHFATNGANNITLEDFEVDGSDQITTTRAGGTFLADIGSGHSLRVAFAHAKVETNHNLDAGEAEFRFNVPAGGASQLNASFNDVWNAPAGGVTQFTGVAISPASDLQVLAITNSDLTISGVPSLATSLATTSQHRPFWVIAPKSPHLGLSPTNTDQVSEFVGQLNIAGELSQYGKDASPIAYFTTTDLSGQTMKKGQLLIDPATQASGHPIVKMCSGEGTLGTLAGVTITCTTGTATGTVNDITNLRAGQWVQWPATPSQFKHILSINPTTLTLTFQSNVTITSAGDAVAYLPATFRTGQFTPLTGSKSWTPTTAQATGTVQTTTVTATGAAVGDMVRVGFTTALPAGCFLAANVTATNTVTVSLANFSGSAQTVTIGTLGVQVFSQ